MFAKNKSQNLLHLKELGYNKDMTQSEILSMGSLVNFSATCSEYIQRLLVA